MIGLLLWTSLATATPLTLDQVREAATSRSMEVEAALARADAARGDAVASWSGHLPAVAAFASGSVGSGSTSFGFDRPVGSQVGLGLTAAWTLVDPSSWQAAAAARQTARGQEAMAAWARVEARRAATTAFAQVVATGETVEAWTRALDDATDAQQAVQALVDAGLRPAVDGARARADAASAEAQLRAAEGARASACAALLGVIQATPSATCEVQPPRWDTDATTPATAQDRDHPALVAARSALDAAMAQRSGAWLERAPTVAASGTAALYAADGGDLGPGWSAGVDVGLPILAGGAIAGGVQGERGREAAARAELGAQERDLAVATLGSEARFRSAAAAVAAREVAYQAAQAALDLLDQRFQAGLSPLTDWLAARRDRDAAAANLALARGELLTALAQVEASRGVW